MRRNWTAGVVALVLVAVALPAEAAIRGDYLEVRSADVYTGPCVANGEMNLVGNEAILAWRVKEGDWNGVDLAGLSVVAVVKANSTLGNRDREPYPAKSVLILDSRASAGQRRALEGFAKAMAGRLLEDVVRYETAAIDLEASVEAGSARLEAGQLARIETRALCAHDHLCGNEVVFYPPLVEVSQATPAFTLLESFEGTGLESVWTRKDKRSAFVATFAR